MSDKAVSVLVEKNVTNLSRLPVKYRVYTGLQRVTVSNFPLEPCHASNRINMLQAKICHVLSRLLSGFQKRDAQTVLDTPA